MDRNAKIKRILAVVVIAIAIMGLVVAVVGIGGSWIVKPQIESEILLRVDRLATVVNRADSVVDQVDNPSDDRAMGIPPELSRDHDRERVGRDVQQTRRQHQCPGPLDAVRNAQV